MNSSRRWTISNMILRCCMKMKHCFGECKNIEFQKSAIRQLCQLSSYFIKTPTQWRLKINFMDWLNLFFSWVNLDIKLAFLWNSACLLCLLTPFHVLHINLLVQNVIPLYVGKRSFYFVTRFRKDLKKGQGLWLFWTFALFSTFAYISRKLHPRR